MACRSINRYNRRIRLILTLCPRERRYLVILLTPKNGVSRYVNGKQKCSKNGNGDAVKMGTGIQ
jgi:hypothetical protein